MSITQEIVIGDRTFVRSAVRARAILANEGNTPSNVWSGVKAVSRKMWSDDPDNFDMCFVKFVLDVEGANLNWDYMPRPSLIKKYSTAVFKPFNMHHITEEEDSMVYTDRVNIPVLNTIFGVMTHAALGRPDGTLLTDKEVEKLEGNDDWSRPSEDRIAVIAWAGLYKMYFPMTVADLIEAIDNESMAVSMERYIDKLDYLVWDGSQYKSVKRAKAQIEGIERKWQEHKAINNKPVFRRALSFVYSAVAGTDNPAQPLSKFLSPSKVKSSAHLSTNDKAILEKLLKRHSELHEAFVVALHGEQSHLIDEHLRVTKAIAAITGD